MKNPLVFPLMILMAALALLVVAILMTPEVEVVQHPTFENIVDGARQGGSPQDPASDGQQTPATSQPESPEEQGASPSPAPEILAADAP